MTCHQRIIREQHAKEHDPFLAEKITLARSFEHATVREISKAAAKTIILKYEWLGNMGCTDYTFGLYFGEHLAGVACFGRTAGTRTAISVCGKDYEHLVRVLNRGACVHWAHPHSASYLIPRACNLMAEKGFNIFVAYSDADAGEIGTVYQATNWLYCGTTKSADSMFVWGRKPVRTYSKESSILTGRLAIFKDGKERNERCISSINRDPGDPYQNLGVRLDLRERMVREGFLFFKTQPKGRYVTFAGDKKLVKELRAAMLWNVLPYPKREVAA
jgi:hypothetical protein